MPDEASNLRVMPSCNHWRLSVYDTYLRTIDKHLANDPPENREYWLTLRHGWVELKRAFEAELRSREATHSEQLRDVTKELLG